MKLCMMSIMMGTNDPVEITEAARYCGMEAIDWVTMEPHKIQPEVLKKCSADAGLKIAAYTPAWTRFAHAENGWREEFCRFLEQAQIMGAPVMMIPPFGRTGQKTLAEGRKQWIGFYTWALPLAQQAGVVLTLEATGLPDSPITTASECLEVLREVPGLKLTLDYGNMLTAGDASDAYPLLKDYIVHIHLKDWKIYSEPHVGATLKRDGRYFADAMIGTGDVDLHRWWNTLDAQTRNLYVNLETRDFTKVLLAREALKQVSDVLRTW